MAHRSTSLTIADCPSAAITARKFLILTCPPTERTPNVIYSENLSTSLFLEAIKAWNAHLHVFVQTIPTLHPDASVRLYDSDQFFNYALDHHAALGFPEENTYYCPSYIEIRGQPELHLPECRQALKHTFWLNSYHPTWPVHKYMSLGAHLCFSPFSSMR